ncbi:MAG: T9SS type A sorting domain-containing protein, partial [candidate division WOR-3 bacterium]
VIFARPNTPIGSKVDFTLYLNYSGKLYTDTINFSIFVGDLITLPIPDNQNRYWAYDDIDIDPQHPTYNWVEIRNLGTRLDLSDDQTVTIAMPFGFTYYGTRYTNLSICSNGWIAAGSTTDNDYTNSRIPDPDGPSAMIAINWDDLYPDTNIWYYHDRNNHRFIIEYDSIRYISTTVRDKFEIIIYDSTVVTPTRDNVILFQFRTANGFAGSTIGIENSNETVGIQDLYDGTYHIYAAPIIPGRAIKFTTVLPLRVEETVSASSRIRNEPLLSISPNPLVKSAQIRFVIERSGPISLEVYNIEGRLIKRLADGFYRPNTYNLRWSGEDMNGKRVSSGVYFIKLKTDSGEETTKSVMMR